MMYEDVVADFAERTQNNLNLLRGIHKQDPENVFEVTQLVNSMLGLIVFPRKEYLKRIPDKTTDEMKSDGWPVPKFVTPDEIKRYRRQNLPMPRKVRPRYADVGTLEKLIRYLRNAIAHFNICFLADYNRNISGVIVWNERKDGKADWVVKLTLEELEEITNRFIALLMKTKGKQDA
jgi:hypothetical protein